MTTPQRPLPRPDDATAPYWEACRAGELRVQRCGSCGRSRFPPQPMCPACHSLESTWALVPGRGHIYSFVIAHPPVLPAFVDRTPLPIVLVELEDDPSIRIVGNLLDAIPDAIEIGLRVEMTFERVTEEITLPQWRLCSS